ncbi:NANOG protein, partial [Polypterus senegalus]
MADWRMPGPYYAYAYSLLYPDQNYWANADGEPMMPQMVPPMLNMASYSEPPPVYPPVQVDSRSDKDSASPDSCSAGDSDILSEGQELPGSARLQALGSPVAGEPVSSTLGDNDGNREVATPDRNNFDATANVKAKKRKLRTAFSQEQMEALRQRFQVQKYLTPVEMKTLATMIGLTYKQIKTWFQNRRMKMKRYQKENSGPEVCFPVMPTTAPGCIRKDTIYVDLKVKMQNIQSRTVQLRQCLLCIHHLNTLISTTHLCLILNTVTKS